MFDCNVVRSGNFEFTKTSIPGVIIVDTNRYEDSRGFFMEVYKRADFAAAGIDCEFVQDNHSSSAKGVLRGLHFQIKHPQAKLVRVTVGEVFDVCVDLRERSSTFGEWVGTTLSAANGRQLFIPRGFAHGFLVLSDRAEICYKCDDVYYPEDEGGIMWNDSEIGINWPLFKPGSILEENKLILSEKDRHHPSFQSYKVKMQDG